MRWLSYIFAALVAMSSYAVDIGAGTVDYTTNSAIPSMFVGNEYVSGMSGIDASTEAIYTIDYEHHELHSGSHYTLSGFSTVASGVTNKFTFKTPQAKEVHLVFEVAGTSQTEFYLHEGVTATGGTAVVPINNNRNSSNTSLSFVTNAPSILTYGTTLYSASHGIGGANPNAADTAGVVQRSNEFILKTNTLYGISLVSRDNGNIITFTGDWYEHTRKNP